MKAINIMNFVRQIDERFPDGFKDTLFQTTKSELELVNEFGFENTFLLQYDAVCDERYASLFRENATEKTELGLWYEIVEPLTTACGLPYDSKKGWKWDWHIIPGFSMAYSPAERELLIDEAMRKFKEVFGYYPRTVASWLIDTHTLRYLSEHYEIDAVAICRDQTNTDAYTLLGGYFNQAYYPSKNNMFTPAQSEKNQINIPVFRLLGPCPVCNYDNRKYLSEETISQLGRGGCYTLEPVWKTGKDPKCVDWFFKTYYENEDLGFSYCQLGQENSMATIDFLPALRMQLEKVAKLSGVTVKKMGDTGAYFKKAFPSLTPATAVVATEGWDTHSDVQSVYFDCRNYMANLFRFEESIFIRALYLFDEQVNELYLTEKCTTANNAVYENLPIVDTLFWTPDEKKKCGLQIDADGSAFTAKKIGEGILAIEWKNGKVVFEDDKITVYAPVLRFYMGETNCEITVGQSGLEYKYKGTAYFFDVENADVKWNDGHILISPRGESCILRPRQSNRQ